MPPVQFLQIDFEDDKLTAFLNVDRIVVAKYQRDIAATIDADGNYHITDEDTPGNAETVETNIFEIQLLGTTEIYYSYGDTADKLNDFFQNKADVYRI
jgi:hypothetical protein